MPGHHNDYHQHTSTSPVPDSEEEQELMIGAAIRNLKDRNGSAEEDMRRAIPLRAELESAYEDALMS
ncbi:hypothetical protein H0H81_003961, partial [Sphagnurus paluster]